MWFVLAFNVLAVGFVLWMRRRPQTRTFDAEVSRRHCSPEWQERVFEPELDEDTAADAALHIRWFHHPPLPAAK